MGKLKPLTESKAYERFIKERDQALEKVLNKYLRSIDLLVESLRIRCHEVASHLSTQEQSRELIKRNRQAFEYRVTPWFDLAAHRTESLIQGLRKTAFALSYVGQAEAIGRATRKKAHYHLDKSKLNTAAQKEMTFGGQIHARVELSYHRLLRDVLDAFQTSQVMESPIADTLNRVDRAFPAKRKIKRIQKLIAPMKESKRPNPSDFNDDLADDEREQLEEAFSTGFLDREEWEQAVKDYTSDELPIGRSPEDKIMLGSVNAQGDEDFVYKWQVEQEATDDFVSQVRNGEIQSAKENGINDFLWIAITDSKTDECCLWRDGLTSDEIEKKLEDEESGDDCDVSVPPAHFNCRCRVAPMTEDMPDEDPPDQSSFDDWINS